MDSYAINPSQINGILVAEASFVADLVQLGYLWRGLLRHRHGHISIHESIILSEIQTKGFELWKFTFVVAVFRASDAAIERELTMLSSSWWFFQLAYLLGKLLVEVERQASMELPLSDETFSPSSCLILLAALSELAAVARFERFTRNSWSRYSN
jgi:hypothetical protein